ncbi:MAG: IPT/TIG domain-containing protein [Deltaproteobacteria bacterium]|nr:IPT/TIG domain-containing protein [Deltaproteobacteria bacterium]
MAGCEPLFGVLVEAELCRSITLSVPVWAATIGQHDVVIQLPTTQDCSAAIVFSVTEPPTVTDVYPFKVCAKGDTFTVEGTSFAPGSVIRLDGAPVPTQYVSETELTGTITEDYTPDTYDVDVYNAEDCVSEPRLDALMVVAAPVVFFADPQYLYNAIDMRVTVWVTGISGTAPTVSIRRTDSTVAPEIALHDPQFNGKNRVFATVTAAMDLAPGDYDVIVDDDPCRAELENALHVTDTLSVWVSGIDPPFGVSSTDPEEDSAVENTSVTISSESATTPNGFDNFEKTPRVYLAPLDTSDPATELKAVVWVDDPSRVDGVVPSDLPAGEYRVVVINPDGGVGLLDSPLYKVLPNDDPPPSITGLTPGQVEHLSGQEITILGENFPTDIANLDVEGRCRDIRDADPASTEQVLTTDGGEIAINSTSSTTIETTWDMGGLATYTCVITVFNLDNASYDRYSAISITESSGNIEPFFDSEKQMVEARRALTAAAIRMNKTIRYLYAIGGDNGAATPVRTATVESVALDPFGSILGDFSLQRHELPGGVGRAFTSGAAAVIGRFVYIAGGRIGADAGVVDNAVLRAYLLDPFEAPEINDLDLSLVDAAGGGMATGVWYYRVAAVMNDGVTAPAVPADANNPGGEGLPSEPLAVQIPSAADGKEIHLNLRWDHIPGAVQYRIYRTTAVGEVTGDELLLGEMNALTDLGNVIDEGGTPLETQTFLDDGIDNSGLDPNDPSNNPMPLGSLGTWRQVATMTATREGAALVAVPDAADSTGATHFLYVLGGRDSSGAYLASTERIKVNSPESNQQTLVHPVDAGQPAAFVASAPLNDARWLLGAVYMDAKKSTQITGSDVWIYALPGEDGPNPNDGVNEVTALKVDVSDGSADGDGVDGDGSLSAVTDVDAPNTKYTGYAYVSNHNYIHVMGGKTGAPHTAGDETYVTTVPSLGNWNAGTNLDESRQYVGTGYESAFVFILGGTTDTALASRTVEMSNF